jgi:hypothetical protein
MTEQVQLITEVIHPIDTEEDRKKFWDKEFAPTLTAWKNGSFKTFMENLDQVDWISDNYKANKGLVAYTSSTSDPEPLGVIFYHMEDGVAKINFVCTIIGGENRNMVVKLIQAMACIEKITSSDQVKIFADENERNAKIVTPKMAEVIRTAIKKAFV